MNKINRKISFVILAGGSGKRMWPLSRENFPKQFLKITDKKFSQFQKTILRSENFEKGTMADTYIITSESQRFIVKEQLDQLRKSRIKIFLEPYAKNTAPALTIAALDSLKSDPILVIFPSDHEIDFNEKCINLFKQAFSYANDDKFVIFGIKPVSPNINFGYIKYNSQIASRFYNVASFEEKPSLAKSKKFLKKGNYLWNSGIFVVRSSVWIKHLASMEVETLENVTMSLKQSKSDYPFLRPDPKFYKKIRSNSIDYSVLEKIDPENIVVGEISSDWDDLGSFDSFKKYLNNYNKNYIKGDVISSSSKENIVFSDTNKLISLLGLNNHVIIDCDDVLSIINRDLLPEYKNHVSLLEKNKRDELFDSNFIHRPWGTFKTIFHAIGVKIKLISVNPKSSLSLQMHLKRAEHWIVVEGTASVTKGEDSFLLKKNESTFIPRKTLHRLENKSNKHLRIVEVQTGVYLGEDDIKRFEDKYGR